MVLIGCVCYEGCVMVNGGFVFVLSHLFKEEHGTGLGEGGEWFKMGDNIYKTLVLIGKTSYSLMDKSFISHGMIYYDKSVGGDEEMWELRQFFDGDLHQSASSFVDVHVKLLDEFAGGVVAMVRESASMEEGMRHKE
ncbi:hypothetical protein L1987_40909 [Smallanthus sonchifolius]|uniref:Uncharacterized protein n=1 Tax=Smallanthus sonchifolius TaxID=185202 RepID=A0ACB9GUZ8_9ASTR|nr:hypothetical protein L1987_40909 [Smallanthus sonchifolius]